MEPEFLQCLRKLKTGNKHTHASNKNTDQLLQEVLMHSRAVSMLSKAGTNLLELAHEMQLQVKAGPTAEQAQLSLTQINGRTNHQSHGEKRERRAWLPLSSLRFGSLSQGILQCTVKQVQNENNNNKKPFKQVTVYIVAQERKESGCRQM